MFNPIFSYAMKDIVKFRNIADYLLESGNYPKAYETYFMVYSEIWVALSKFRNTIISRNAFKNGQSDEVIELIKYGKLHQVFFERFKLVKKRGRNKNKH